MKDRRGFTLIEILIVIAIVAIMTVIATTNFFSWQSHYSSVGFQREFLSKVNEARTRSMGTSLQHRLLIDNNATDIYGRNVTTVTLQVGNSGNSYSGWTNARQTQTVVGERSRGTGVYEVLCTPTLTVPTLWALVFNPNGEVLVQTNPAATTASPLTQANIHISATSEADRATITVFGWTSKARLANGWL